MLDEGDVIGVTYDHELLNFYHNGDDLESTITGIRGTIYPVFYGKPILFLGSNLELNSY